MSEIELINVRDLLMQNPHIRRIIESEQFPYSERIMDLRLEMNKSAEEMAQMAGISLDFYISLEYSDTDISVREYKKVIHRLENYRN